MAHYKSIVHIGTHKTGTTSIQNFLWQRREWLRDHGYAFYQGMHIGDNHAELHASAMRAHRNSPFRHVTKLLCDQAYKDDVRRRVDEFAAANEENRLIFSAEGLSYLRYEDEFDWLAGLMLAPVLIVVYLRNRVDFLRSYKGEMEKHGLSGSDCRDSVAYTNEDTWLLDYDERLTPFRERFGCDHVVSIDYDDAVEREVSVIPSFLRVLGLCEHVTEEETRIFLNRSPR